MTIISCMVPEISSVTDRIFSHFMLFFALLPPNNPENQNFEKMKKIPGDITILLLPLEIVPWIKIIWCMIPEIWSTTEIFFSHFGPFFALLNLPPTLNNPKNQNFEKMRKSPRDIIILHKCTINGNYMIYGSSDINCNRQIFFVISCHFWPFYPLRAQKI